MPNQIFGTHRHGPRYWGDGPRNQTDYTLAFVGTWPSNPADVLTSSSQWIMHDPQDRVWTFQTFPDPGTGTYRVGRPISVTFRGGLQWTFTYGTHNELTSIQDSYGKTITFTWILRDMSAVGGTGIFPNVISKATLPDGTTLNYVYSSASGGGLGFDDSDQLIGVEHRDASNVLLDSTSYLYENVDLPWSVTGITDHPARAAGPSRMTRMDLRRRAKGQTALMRWMSRMAP